MSAMMLESVRCPTHGATMEQRPTLHQTPEQKFCGVWWDCRAPRCSYTVLFQSKGLREQLASMAARVTPEGE